MLGVQIPPPRPSASGVVVTQELPTLLSWVRFLRGAQTMPAHAHVARAADCKSVVSALQVRLLLLVREEVSHGGDVTQ